MSTEPPQVVPIDFPTPPPDEVGVSTGMPDDMMTVDTGTTVTIYCPLTGANIPSVMWFKDNVMFTAGGRISISTTTLPGADITSVVTITDFQPKDAGVYRCTGNNVVGVDSGQVTLQQGYSITCIKVASCALYFKLRHSFICQWRQLFFVTTTG